MTADERRLEQVGVNRISVRLVAALACFLTVLLPVIAGIASYHQASAGMAKEIQEGRLESARLYATKDDVRGLAVELKGQLEGLQRSNNDMARELGRLTGVIQALPKRR